MLRIIFSPDDVARTRLAERADPLWELVLSIQMLRGQPGDLLFTPWRRAAAAALHGQHSPGRWRTLLSLVPTLGYFPDFLNPAAGIEGLEHGLDAIRSTPRRALARDLTRLTRRSRPAPGWTGLASGDVAELRRLTDVMRDYYDATIGPLRARLGADVEQDRQVRLRAFTQGGVEGMLASLRPTATWSGGELSVPGHQNQVIDLGGRGIVLLPSYFCVVHPMTLFDGSLPPVLVYPVANRGQVLPARRGSRQNLAALIGATRAAVLESMSAAQTTTEIAHRAGISKASASEHTAVLRAAGLLSTHRDGRRALHSLTRLGHELLNGTPHGTRGPAGALPPDPAA